MTFFHMNTLLRLVLIVKRFFKVFFKIFILNKVVVFPLSK